jgi:predicted glycoside hydrolase/deacetylase ChbG (UPF0249 family)
MSQIFPRVVINADDFGYSTKVNEGIERALHLGRINSATLMANGPKIREAIAIARHFPAASFGIHLNLTEFSSLSKATGLSKAGLVDRDGLFRNNLRSLRPSPSLLQACFNELDSQIRFLQENGIQPSHLDSHHHIHTVGWLFPMIYRLQRKHRIRRMRNTMNVYSLSGDRHRPIKQRLGKALWRSANTICGSQLTQVFTGLHIFLENPSRSAFTHARSIELMCHPGQQGFEQETEALMRTDSPIPEYPYRLCSYQDVFAQS